MTDNVFCIDCDILIERDDKGDLKGKQYKQGYRCNTCIIKKKFRDWRDRL